MLFVIFIINVVHEHRNQEKSFKPQASTNSPFELRADNYLHPSSAHVEFRWFYLHSCTTSFFLLARIYDFDRLLANTVRFIHTFFYLGLSSTDKRRGVFFTRV